MSIKYYHLAKDEELPEEFCAIRDEGGEPNGYVFYMPESEVAKLREESSKYHDLYVHAIADAEVWHLQWSAEHQENAKLRELVRDMYEMAYPEYPSAFEAAFADRMRELGVEVNDD